MVKSRTNALVTATVLVSLGGLGLWGAPIVVAQESDVQSIEELIPWQETGDPSTSQDPISSEPKPASVMQNRLVSVYLTNTKSSKDRSAAIKDTGRAVKKFYSDQGYDLRWNPSDVTVVRDTVLAKSAVSYGESENVAQQLVDAGVISNNEIPLIYVERSPVGTTACGWAEQVPRFSASLPVGACGIYPARGANWPYDGSYLLGHEIAHTLGADHVNSDPSDVLYSGPKSRSWNNLRIGKQTAKAIRQSPAVQ